MQLPQTVSSETVVNKSAPAQNKISHTNTTKVVKEPHTDVATTIPKSALSSCRKQVDDAVTTLNLPNVTSPTTVQSPESKKTSTVALSVCVKQVENVMAMPSLRNVTSLTSVHQLSPESKPTTTAKTKSCSDSLVCTINITQPMQQHQTRQMSHL